MALTAGDLAVVGFDTDSPDTFSFVLLVDVAAGEQVFFTDNGWNGTSLATNENSLLWIAPVGGLARGTVIRVDAGVALDAALGTTSGALSGLSASGEQILVYQGLAIAPTFLYAVNNAGAWTTSGTISSNTSYLPPGLVAGTTALFLTHLDNYAYNGPTSGSRASLLAAIGDAGNWVASDTKPVAVEHPTAFSVTGGAPTVNLSVTSNLASEADPSIITVTATTSSAVNGDQTVTVEVGGTGVQPGDYLLGSTIITILDGQTSGSTTLTIVDDALVEGNETATVALSNPSAGMTLGATVSQSLTISDNDTSGLLTYAGTLNEGRMFDGSVVGTITITLSGAETFAGTNGDDLLAGGTPKATLSALPTGLSGSLIRLSASSAELRLSGTAAAHSADVEGVSLRFFDSAFTGGMAAAVVNATYSNLSIQFADQGVVGSVQTFTPNSGTTSDSSDASTALALNANEMIVGDDEASVLRVYDRAGGNALVEWSFASHLNLGGGELDLEGSTRIGDTLYFIGSHSNSSGGNEQNSREHLFSVTVTGSGAQTQFSFGASYAGLEGLLTTWDSSNGHGLGANYFGFASGSANGVVPESVGGFSIEGLTHDGSNLLLAFRAPQADTASRDRAVLVPLIDAFGTPNLGAPVQLNLGGRGIRSIERSADGNSYLILAGPAGAASLEVTHDFRLFTWDGSSTTVAELDVPLDSLRDGTGGSLESLVDVVATSTGTLVQLLLDNGDTVWPGRTGASKDLPASQQQFQGTWVSLGAAATDTDAPSLVGSSPSSNAANVAENANIVLRFDEGVTAGSGNFVIRRSNDASAVASIAAADATQVGFAFNTVTINPSADLAAGTGYYLEADANALTDHAGLAWSGLQGSSGLNFTTTSAAPSYNLLITELNSNAAGGDFFELYNTGSTAIDLTGWKWDDDSANRNDAAAASLTGSLLPGARLVVVASSDAAAFRAAWGLPESVPVLAAGGPGLGGGDAVVVFDQNGHVAAALNYKTTAITASDGTVIAPIVRADGVALASGHAGLAAGGVATESAVWDGVSSAAPRYDNAVSGVLGAFAQGTAATNVGSPGEVRAGASLSSPYTEAFGSSLGEFTVVSSDADAINAWYRNSSAGAAEVNAFGDSAAASDWLISKAFDLNQTSVEYLSFTTWARYVDAGIVNPEVKLKYSTDYPGAGDPSLYTWTELSYNAAAENSQTGTQSGLIDLAAIRGSHVHFAFHYTSSGTGSNSSTQWRVDDVRLEAYTGAVLSVAAADAARVEGNSGTTDFTFTVTRSGVTTSAVTVDFAINGAAVTGDDFAGGVLPSGSLSFAAGELSKTMTIAINGDTVVEPDEAFTVTLSNASIGATLAQSTATGTIRTDDVGLTLISAIQGSGSASALQGQAVTIEGLVTAYMPELRGFFVQEQASDSDNNAATSEGVFVYYNTTNPGISAGNVGDVVRLTGTVAEFRGQTQLTSPNGLQIITDHVDTASLPAPVSITLPIADMVNWEAVEGMLVQVASATESGGRLVVTDNYNLGRYGSVTLTSDTILTQFTETNAPSVSGYATYQATVQRDQIILDDGSSSQNPAVHLGRNGQPLSASNTMRAGDAVTSVVGVVDQFVGTGSDAPLGYETTYRLQPTLTPNFTGDARPTAASIPTTVTSAEIKLASVNVLNYFTTLGASTFNNPNGTSHEGRGATNAAEFTRQQDKLVSSVIAMNADVLALQEIQNNGFADGNSALDSLVDALNAVAGAGTYAYVRSPYNDGAAAGDAATAGDDAIMVALLYKPGKVQLVGQAAVADPAHYDAFSATYGNRVPVAQTFEALGDGERFTVVVNHFKSKGSVIDADVGDGQGANNLARMEAARDLLAWLATDPTSAGDADVMLMGDFNAYSHEDPITHLASQGFTRVSSGLSYSFDGLWGSLDHALASASLTSQITGAYKWGINAEEPVVLDYNTEFRDVAQQTSYYNADPYRSSDHNPILIGLNLGSAAPTEGADRITGTAGDDLLDGLGGDDVLVGLAGNDRYVISQSGDRIEEATDAGIDVALTHVSFVLTQHVEDIEMQGTADLAGSGNTQNNRIVGNAGNNWIAGAAGQDTLYGDDGNDVLFGDEGGDLLYGQAGDDWLNGGEGDDLMAGGVGNDRYLVDSVGDILEEVSDGGIDTVEASGDFVLYAHLENLVLTGAAVNGSGNAGNNWIQGNAANNWIGGGDGHDSIDGGHGDDSLHGDAGDDVLVGGEGQDELDGGAGFDRMYGGAGDDRYIVTQASDEIYEDAAGGTDTVVVQIDNYVPFANTENILLAGSVLSASGNAADNWIEGNAGNNFLGGGAGHDRLLGLGGDDWLQGDDGGDTLEGGDGHDTLMGGVGVDTLIGGAGNDIYFVDGPGDQITETADGGIDTVYSSGHFTLSGNLENLVMTGTQEVNGTGDAGGNWMRGNDAANTLNGQAGADYIDGAGGVDTLIGGSGDDILVGGVGSDTYVFNPIDGLDTLIENDGTLGNSDTLVFSTGIDANDLWFAQQGLDLVITVGGTDSTDAVTVRDWFADAAHQIEQIVAGSGRTLSSGQVSSLVSALAGSGQAAPEAGSMWTSGQQAALDLAVVGRWS